ncbi:MAG TPA: hypothetical protein VH157_06940 [Bryobacteraceae bacterium]|jgi:hypothetical protein|nr:hypothetical protein [Bryobacteraceae bacterium]
MTYVQLRAAIQEYSQDFEASFVENVDNYIRLAESRILLRVRLPRFRKDATAALIPPAGTPPVAQPLLPVPSDFLAPDSVAITTINGLVFPVNKDPEFLDECYPDLSFTGTPRFYAYLNESSLKFAPAPDQAYPVSMGYFYQPPSIVDMGTSWLGDHFSHALLSGSLVEAAKFMKSEDNIFVRYDQAFEKDLAMDKDYAKGRTKKDTYQEPDVRTDA